jgi:hypothetical protein
LLAVAVVVLKLLAQVVGAVMVVAAVVVRVQVHQAFHQHM